jgi:hypothetical protein
MAGVFYFHLSLIYLVPFDFTGSDGKICCSPLNDAANGKSFQSLFVRSFGILRILLFVFYLQHCFGYIYHLHNLNT